MKINFARLQSVESKFLIWIIPTIIIILIVLAVIIYITEKQKQTANIDKYSVEIVKARSNEIEEWLQALIVELQHIARRNIVKSLDWQVMGDEIKDIAEEKKHIYDFIAFIKDDGYYFSTLKGASEKSVKDMNYFIDVMQNGKDYAISNPYYSLTTGEPIFLINVPVKNNGEVQGCIAGIIQLTTLSKMVGDIKIGEYGYGWIVDNEGLVFAHPLEDVAMQLNVLKADEEGFKNFNTVGKQMLKNNTGSGTITTPDGTEEYLVYSKIPLSPDWTFGIAIPTQQAFSGIYSLMKYLIVSFVLTALIISLIVWILAHRIITRPLKKLTGFIHYISRGHLFETISIKSNDEVGTMADSLRNMQEQLRKIATKIRESSGSIASGSNEISLSASQIAEGAGEQASSTEQVSASMEEMVATIDQNSDNAIQTEKTAIKAAKDIEEVKESVATTIKAINEIAKKITIINDIAEKTDLLAINAAVEAARAGEHGKGFAVVASEVRKLSENSQKAANAIIKLSADTVDVAENSGKLLDDVVPLIKNNADLVREISAASVEQNSGANQVNNAVQQLTQITQQNSSSAEELATGSEQLAQQADILKEIVMFFKVKREDLQNNINDIAYQKLLETLKVFKESNQKNKKIEIDLADIQSEIDKAEQTDNENDEEPEYIDEHSNKRHKGVKLNLDDEALDNEYKKMD